MPLACLGNLKPGQIPRILSSEYACRIARFSIASSFRKACELFNIACERIGTDHEISLSTFVRDVFKIGKTLITYKNQKVRKLLKENGFDQIQDFVDAFDADTIHIEGVSADDLEKELGL